MALPLLVAAERAIDLAGKSHKGKLALDGGRLRFETEAGKTLARSLARSGSTLCRRGRRGRSVRVVHLDGGQRLAGRFQKLDGDVVAWQPSWSASSLKAPHSTVRAVGALARGWRTLLDDDSDDEAVDVEGR